MSNFKKVLPKNEVSIQTFVDISLNIISFGIPFLESNMHVCGT